MNYEHTLAFICGMLMMETITLAVVLFAEMRSLERFQQLEEEKEAAVRSAAETRFPPPYVS